MLHVSATSYRTWDDWRWSPTLFSSDGAGSLLDLSKLTTITVPGGWGGAWTYSISANNSGVIDLSGLETVAGPRTDYYDGEDWLAFSVNNAAVMRVGAAFVSRRTRFAAGGRSSRIESRSAYFRSPASLSVSDKATFEVAGDFLYENTDPNTIVVEDAYLQMDGTQPQRLEVGGKDLGPAGSTARNFGYSQLIVGETNRASVVRLVDGLDNGNRGAGGDPECLYLYGMDGAGLRLLNGSRLILNILKVYALVNGQMQSLASLIPAGTNSAPFGDGFIALTGGPKITNMVPAMAILPPVASVEVRFDIPIDETSLTAGDVTVLGPGGAVPVTAVTKIEGNTYRMAFVPQSVSGLYTVRVGPGVNELAGNLAGMDQNGNGLSGEPEADVFTGYFNIDGDPPVVVGAFALQSGNRVGLTFSEPVEPSFATNPANYRVDGLAPTSATLQTNGTQVVLTVSPTLGSAFALAVTDATDLVGNQADRQFTGTILPLEPSDIGNPGSDPYEIGSTVAFTEEDFDCVGGGSSIWGGIDAFHFLFERRTGDFDVRAQVARLDQAASSSESGILLRESLAGDALKIQAIAQSYSGSRYYYLGVRASSGGGVSYAPGIVCADTWIRLRREGTVFTAYRGTNGTDWVEYGRVTNDFPISGYLGLGTCADNNNVGQAVIAWYRNYGDLSPSIQTQPQDQSVASGTDVTFGVVARGLAPLTYQWFQDGVALAGATAATLLLPGVQIANVGDYSVTVRNEWGAATSQAASLTVNGMGVDAGLEGDVAPAPLGDGVNTMQDWVKVGLFVASLESPSNSSQFQRADAAPEPCGDGRLTVADWTMAGLYAAGLIDPVQACGPKTPGAGLASAAARGATLAGPGPRVVRVLDAAAQGGEPFETTVELEAVGNENAVGLSLEFDPNALRFIEAAAGLGAADAVLQVNARRAAEGRVGLALAKPIGIAFNAGKAQLVRVRFVPIGLQESCTLAFGDRPIAREVVDTWAEVLPAQYVAGKVTMDLGPRLSGVYASGDGRFTVSFSTDLGTRWAIEASSDLVHWTELGMLTATEGAVTFTDETARGVNPRFYRLRQAE
ncbi:MAG TPA: hypothetical protein P5534_05000 [Candidatus Paceibacterota bacterium]|nr:hypothetical protein [Candidatus Paceibacterota bacterium]